MKEYQVELLAPAGSKDAFLGAIHAGADAVYLAGDRYGARAYADNFTQEELLWCIRYAHIWGRKVYLTVNTLMKDAELEELYAYLLPFYEVGLDACIVQDLGAFQSLKKWFPDMELHVSTQMTITGAHGAGFLKELGATRIVPARELSLEEIRRMKEETGLEMETFIHGAMCYCYSGQCLFSSIIGGRSGNRGRCAQPCRLPYQVKQGKKLSGECYPLSLKDMCTLEHIEAWMDAGIDSFKIEGRMKKPEYAAGVTAIYRKYMDLKKKYPDKKLAFQQKDLEQLSKLYIRSERQDGYYFKQNGRDMVTLQNPAYSGSDEALLAEIRQKYVEAKPKKSVDIYASLVQGQNAMVTFVCEGLSVVVEGQTVEKAQNTAISAESIEKQLRKLGDTCFEATTMEVFTDGESFYSVKALNELRREAVRLLEDMFIEEQGLCVSRKTADVACAKEDTLNIVDCDGQDDVSQVIKLDAEGIKKCQTDECKREQQEQWSVLFSTKEQLRAYEQYCMQGTLQFERVYLESELILNGSVTEQTFKGQQIYIALPYCMRFTDENKLEKLVKFAGEHSDMVKGFLVRNLEEYGYLKNCGYSGELYGDAGLYVWNQESLSFWEERLTGVHCPWELNRKEWHVLFDGHSFEKNVYGRIPMMVTANCIAKTTDKCYHGTETMVKELVDRYKKQFPVAVSCTYCTNIIYNSLPVSLHKDMAKDKTKYTKKLLLTVENEKETLDVLRFWEQINNGRSVEPPYGEYTTAHEKRGVE